MSEELEVGVGKFAAGVLEVGECGDASVTGISAGGKFASTPRVSPLGTRN